MSAIATRSRTGCAATRTGCSRGLELGLDRLAMALVSPSRKTFLPLGRTGRARPRSPSSAWRCRSAAAGPCCARPGPRRRARRRTGPSATASPTSPAPARVPAPAWPTGTEVCTAVSYRSVPANRVTAPGVRADGDAAGERGELGDAALAPPLTAVMSTEYVPVIGVAEEPLSVDLYATVLPSTSKTGASVVAPASKVTWTGARSTGGAAVRGGEQLLVAVRRPSRRRRSSCRPARWSAWGRPAKRWRSPGL